MPQAVRDDDGALIREISAELRALAEEQAASIEHIEPLAARLGLSQDATAFALRENQRRLRLLTLAQRHFERLVA